MKNNCLFFALAGAVLLAGCDKQTKLNVEKTAALSQKMAQSQQIQAAQLAAIQTQLTSLAPMLDKMNDFYFTKSHDDAFFFHTNTLYLLLTVDKKIESRLQVAETERESENALACYYHTNQTDTMYFCLAQIQDAVAAQEKRMTANVNAETKRLVAATGDELQARIAAADAAQAAKLSQLAADVAQMKRDLEQLKAQLAQTNPPAARP